MNVKTAAFKTIAAAIKPLVPIVCPDAKHAISVFIFHGVTPDGTDKMVCGSSKSVSNLREGLISLKQSYEIISIGQAVELIAAKKPLSKSYVVLTFDDSVKSIAKLAAPIVAELGLPAIVYASTEVLNNQSYYWWHRLEYAVAHAQRDSVDLTVGDERYQLLGKQENIRPLKGLLKNVSDAQRWQIIEQIEHEFGARLTNAAEQYPCAEPMDWQDIPLMLEMGLDIGNHTVSHTDLRRLGKAEIRAEYAEAEQSFLERAGFAPKHLSYPYGHWDRNCVEVARELGMVSAVTCDVPGWNQAGQDPLELRRFSMHPDAWKAPFQVSGVHDTIARLKRGELSPN